MNSTINTLPEIQQDIETVERLMLSQADNYYPDLKSAISILLYSGGKRIRPRIILLLRKILNADKNKSIFLAAAIELLHTATLVHDDLIDGSLLRRGVPTLNSKWSPAATVLTGDFIFGSAASVTAKINSVEVMKIFSKTLMTIVNGEVNQLFASRWNTSKADYLQRIYAKTASLFETSTQATAMISNASPVVIEKMRKFGYELGMAFQIVDDVLDYSGDQSIVGKPIGEDLRQGLVTLPMLYYMELNRQDKGVQELEKEHMIKNEETIERLIQSISSSSAIDQSLKEAEQYAKQALDIVSELPNSPEKDELVHLTESSVMRKN